MSKLFLLPSTAFEVASGLIKVFEEVAPGSTATLNLNTGIPHLVLTAENLTNFREDPGVKTFLKTVEGRPVPCTSASVKVPSGGHSFTLNYKLEAYQAFLAIESPANSETAVALLDSASKHFNATHKAVLGASLPAAEQDAMRFKEQVLGDMKVEVSRLGVFLTQMAEKNAEAVRTLTTDLETRFQQRQAELESSVRAQREAVDVDRRAFEQEREKFNDRKRTHVRRELLEKIQTNITNRATATPISTGARVSRGLIHGVSGAILVASVIGGFYAAKHLYAAAGRSPFDWRVVPPFTFAAIIFTATLVFYLRWVSRWADRLAHDDLAASQYASDILRASWVAELLFEYKDEQGKEIAPEVIASLTEGLFKREDFKGERYHPSEDLHGVLARLRRFKAGPDGVELLTSGRK